MSSHRKGRRVKRKKKSLPLTRKVVVRVFATQRIGYAGDIVITVPADMDDDDVGGFVWNDLVNLPEPDEWEEVDFEDDLEIDEGISPVVIRSACCGEPSVARLEVDDDDNVEVVT